MKNVNKNTEYQMRLETVLKKARKKDELYDLFGKPSEMVISPKNNFERKYGEAFISYAEDYLELDLSLEYDEIYFNNLNNSIFLEYIINTVNTYNDTGSKKQLRRVINAYSSPKDLAAMSYEQKIMMDTAGKEVMEFVLLSCGYDPTNNEDIEEFTQIYKLVRETAGTDSHDLTKKDMIKFIEKAECFHQIHNNIMLGENYTYKKIYLS